MKKLGIGIAAAVAALVVGGATTSYVMGGKLQEGFESTAKDWSKPPLGIEVQSYERGLFSSTAKTLWTVNTGDEQVQFTARHEMKHGPWPRGHAAEIATTFAINADAPPEWVTAYKDKAPLVWNATVGWSKKSQHNIASPAISGNFDGEKLSFGGFTANFEMPGDLKGMKGTATMPSLLIQPGPDSADKAEVQLGTSNMRFDVKQAAGQEFMVGSFNWALDKLAATSKGKNETTTLVGFVMDTDTQLQGDVVNTTVNTKVQSFAAPDTKVSDIAVDLALRNLDAAWLNQVTKASQEAQGNPQLLQGLLMGGLQQLLAKKPELEIKRISWRSDEGVSEVAASVTYQGDPATSPNPLADIKASARLSMPKPVLYALMTSRVRDGYLEQLDDGEEPDAQMLSSAVQEDVDARLGMLLQSGILVEKDNLMTTQLDYSAGKVQANGKELNNESMMGLMQAMP